MVQGLIPEGYHKRPHVLMIVFLCTVFLDDDKKVIADPFSRNIL